MIQYDFIQIARSSLVTGNCNTPLIATPNLFEKGVETLMKKQQIGGKKKLRHFNRIIYFDAIKPVVNTTHEQCSKDADSCASDQRAYAARSSRFIALHPGR